jgi:hypothetical protein
MADSPDASAARAAAKLEAKEARKAARREAKLLEKEALQQANLREKEALGAAEQEAKAREKQARGATREDAKIREKEARRIAKRAAKLAPRIVSCSAEPQRSLGIVEVDYQTLDRRVLAPGSDLSGEADFLSIDLQGDFSEAALLRARRIVPVRQPIVLIAQVQRSGGHLLARLLDGHPDCLNHPHELQWGRPKKDNWPSFEVDARLTPDAAFALVRERWLETAVADGALRVGPGGPASHPFQFDQALHETLFKAMLALRPPVSRRDVLDAYLTASFNAWLDYHGLYATPKRYVTAFIPRVTMVPDSLDRFFHDYPDGRLVTIVRQPGSWLASALRNKGLQREHGGDAEAALGIWSTSTEASLRAAERFGVRVTVVLFDELIHRTRDVMARLCDTLGLAFHLCLTTPTLNGMPVRSNSLFQPVEGIDVSATERHRSALSSTQAATVATSALPLYEAVRARHGLGEQWAHLTGFETSC